MDFNTGVFPGSSGNLGETSSIFVTNLALEAINNNLFFATKWTSRNMQFALMSVPIGSETGWDIHQNSDQFFYIEQGSALITMGICENCLNFQSLFYSGFGAFVPAGIWFNVVNTGPIDLKMFTVCAPALHTYNAVFETKEEWSTYNES